MNTSEATAQGSSSNDNENQPNPIIVHKNSQDNLSLQFEKEAQDLKEENIQKVSNFGGIINLFKAYIGSGMLALPFSFNQAGYLYASIFLISLGSLSFYNCSLLVKVGEKVLKPGQSYSDLCEKLLKNKVLAYGMKFVLIFSCLSGCISYVIFFVTFFEHALEDLLPKIAYLGFALLIIFPITMITNIGGLVKYSFVANGIVILTIISVLIQNCIDIFSDFEIPDSSWQLNKGNMVNIEKTSLVIGVGLFSFDSSYVLMGIRDSLKKPSDFIPKVLSRSIIVVAILYILFACSSVLAKGHQMEEIVLFTFSSGYFRVIQLLYAIALALSYPIFFCTAVKIMENEEGIVGKAIAGLKMRRVVFRVFVTLMVVVVAFLVPRFAIVINLFGSISGACSQFLFPWYACYVVFGDSMGRGQKGFNLFVLLIGLSGCGLGIYGSIDELI